ncbi:MAG: S-layer protein [Candidatus Aenigmarchaeota archaeon]|nr:S-layer protein [Candidatus Aenigmarchaeota archaeon]
MNIKKVVAGGLATLGATLALIGAGMAATSLNEGLQPYVKITDTTLSSPWIVIGRNADAMDVVGAADLAASLVSNYAVVEKTVPSGESTTTVTNGFLITSDLNKTYLGKGLNQVKTAITDLELPDLLAKQTFTDKNGTTITYTQKIVPSSIATTFGTPSGSTEPAIYMPITTSTTPYNLTITFLGGLDPTAVDNTYSITLFGKEYTFGNTHTNTTLELYSSAGAQIVSLVGANAEQTVTVGDKTFDITLTGWNSGGTVAYLTINGQSYTWNEHLTYTVNGVKFYVQSVDVIYTGAQEASGQVKLFVGTDKLYLQNGEAIQKNDVSKNTLVYFSSPSSNKINSITFVVYPDDDVYLTDGTEFVDPVFGTFKVKISDMTPASTSDARDLIKFSATTSNVRLTFTNKDGTTYTNIPIYYCNSSTTCYNKVDSTYDFHVVECNVSASTGNITKGDYFVLSSGGYTYVMKYSSYTQGTDDTKTYVTLTDVSTGTNYKVYPNVGEKLTMGSLEFPVLWNDDKSICISLNGDNNYDGAQVNITTAGNAKIQIDTTNANTTVVYEDSLYDLGGNDVGLASTITVSSTYSTTAGVRFSLNPNPMQVGSNNEWKYVTNYGTYIYVTGDNNGKSDVSIYNPGKRPAFVNVAIGSDPTFTTSTSTGGTYNEAVPVTNPIAKFPSEVSQDSTLDKDLILVGGPCANDIVKTLLNEAWNTSDSCDYWLNQDDVLKNGGNGLIKVVEDVFGSGHKALIVAGTNAEDTRALIANYVIKPSKMSTLTGDEYKGPVA